MLRTLLFALCALAITAAACTTIGIQAPTPAPSGWVSTIVVQTANAASTATALAAPRPGVTPTPVVACLDSAALIEDPANATASGPQMGAKFTRTWQFKNTGQCSWRGYSLAFSSGDRMGAPDSVPIADTPPGSTTTVSMDLLAPATAGSFTGTFELHDASGEPLQIDQGTPITVSVAIADAATPTAEAVQPVVGPVLPPPPPGCQYVKSASYPGEIMDLINKARAEANPPLPALTVNPNLVTSAQSYSTDMACNNYFSHEGRNHSTIHDRVVAAGYTPKMSEEMIFCGGYPKDAFTWWMGDPPHKDVILDTRVKEIGVGYTYLAKTACGSYYVVDLGVQ